MYAPEVTSQLAKEYASEGFSNRQIAKKLGIGYTSLYKWIAQYPEFKEALNRGKDVVNIELKDAMIKTAIGYFVEEEETVVILDVETHTATSINKTTKKKYIAPNATMQVFLAKNRMPEEFKEVNRQEITGADGKPLQVKSNYDLSLLTEDELLKLREIMVKANATTSESTDNK